MTPEGFGNFSFSLGNYGETSAWIGFDFKSTTNSLIVIDPNYSGSVVLLPISFYNNQQYPLNFIFKVDNNTQYFGYQLKILVYGNDLLDTTAARIKILFGNVPTFNCNYTKLNSTYYTSVS